MNPFIVRIDALGAAQVAADDEMLLLVRPNNAVTWKKLEQVQELLVQATNKGVCVAMVNPELQSYAAVNGTTCRPMVLSDFAATFCIDPAAFVLNQEVHVALLKRYPREWELYRRDVRRPDLGYLYFSQSRTEPSQVVVREEFFASGMDK
ncbi:hypothetical protein JKP88DRAFT_215009 [Tribonema minus]|uniref:DUF1995 domain-containing protein n=1 Tax=Tribonema minus TaxID=303371 RepID=A0A835Z076_9STRA|nr:hypothetical protein JKP88DRAFT_215009 [Tribonema minus]